MEDLLTFRLGFGSIMAAPGTYPIQEAEAELGPDDAGAALAATALRSDEWIARFATLPLLHQPGAEWRYNTGAQVLGVLLERATGQPLEAFLRERLFDPLGMVDTSFSVPAAKVSRFTTAYMPDDRGGLGVLDPPSGRVVERAAGDGERGRHARLDARRLLGLRLHGAWRGDAIDGQQLLSPGAVEAMTRDHLTAAQRAVGPIFLGEHGGWGYGMAAPGPTRRRHPSRRATAGTAAPAPSGPPIPTTG